jgi:hypothetical protein
MINHIAPHTHTHTHIYTHSEDTGALGGPFTPTQPPTQPARRRRSGSFSSMGSSGSSGGGGGGWFGRRLTAGAWDGGERGSGPLPLHRDRMARRKFFADAGKLRAYYFEPGLVYGAVVCDRVCVCGRRWWEVDEMGVGRMCPRVRSCDQQQGLWPPFISHIHKHTHKHAQSGEGCDQYIAATLTS